MDMPKLYFQTHGCSANLAESEMMMGLAQAEGNAITCEQKDADILVINICTVKGDSNALKQNRKWIGWKGEIIIYPTNLIIQYPKVVGYIGSHKSFAEKLLWVTIDEIGKNNSFIGRNFAYKPVVVKG